MKLTSISLWRLLAIARSQEIVCKTLRRMKLTAILILLTIVQASAGVYSQKITLALKDAPIEQVFRQIEQQTNFTFLADAALIDKSKRVTVSIKDVDIKEALEDCFKEQPFTYTIEGRIISVVERANIPRIAFINEKPPITVRGRIADENGEPVVASISVKGSSRGTSSDANGDFQLVNISSDAVLIISATNIEEVSINVSGKTSLSIAVKTVTTSLNEVVVNKGYYTTRRRLETGNVSTVTSKEISKQPVINPLSALQGRVPGLEISQTTGLPGGSFNVRLRGQNSIANGNDPLYIIDEIPVSSQTLGSINQSLRGGNPFNFLNVADIESIDVLKDADATAIYGSRGANGVILITTKKGQTGKTMLSVNISSGKGRVTRKMDLMNTQQYLEMRHEAFKNDNIDPTIANAPDLLLWDTNRYTDWQKELFDQPANYNDAQVSLSGGNGNTIFVVSGGLHKETTVLPGNGADLKGSMHVNLANTSANKKFRINLSASFISDKNTVLQTDLAGAAFYLPPNAPKPYNADGTINWEPATPGGAGTWGNPFTTLLTKYKGRTNNLLGNATISYSILPNLEIKTSLGYNSLRTNEFTSIPLTFYDPSLGFTSGSSEFNYNNSGSWIAEPQLNYKVNIVKGLLSVLLGGTFQESISERQGYAASAFTSDALLENILAAGTVNAKNNIDNQYRYCAGFGRLNYSWENKYLVNVTMRRDGSTRFGPSRQWATFAAAGAAWIFSEESFIKNALPALSLGKFRGSYGTGGSDQVPDYYFLDLYSPSRYTHQGSKGLAITKLFNPYLAWELNRKLEFGLELGFLNNRINMSAGYYRNRSGNQVVSAPLSYVTGFSNITTNIPAKVQNKGWEFILNTVNIKTKNFLWSSSFNTSINRNKLLSFPDIDKSASYNSYYVVGEPIILSKIYNSAGVDPETGVNIFYDAEGKTTLEPDFSKDRTAIIHTAPKFFGGFQNTFGFKNFELNCLFQFVKQTGANYYTNYQSVPGFLANQPVNVLDRWQKPGDNKTHQMYTQDYGIAYNSFSYYTSSNDAYSDASFIRLKNISLSWNIPNAWKRNMNLQNGRIYVQCQNLLTITNYKGLDPETQVVGVPPLRVITAGIQFGL
jgi:TonB-dependent starch-binding outer membrane protein SusC